MMLLSSSTAVGLSKPVGSGFISRGQLRSTFRNGPSFGARSQLLRSRAKVVIHASADVTPAPKDPAEKAMMSAALTMRNISFINFWVQLPLTLVSAGVLLFSVMVTKTASAADFTKYFTLAGIFFSLLSTFFAHGFLTLARRWIDGKEVNRQSIMNNLFRNNTINFIGTGITLIGLQSAVGTLVGKTLIGAVNAPYATPQPGATLISLDVFALQASTNTLLAHFLSLVFTGMILRLLEKLQSSYPIRVGYA